MLRWQDECTAEWQKQYQDSWLPAHHVLTNRVVVASCDYYFVGKGVLQTCRNCTLVLADRTSARLATCAPSLMACMASTSRRSRHMRLSRKGALSIKIAAHLSDDLFPRSLLTLDTDTRSCACPHSDACPSAGSLRVHSTIAEEMTPVRCLIAMHHAAVRASVLPVY